jgi:hypothetical protein
MIYDEIPRTPRIEKMIQAYRDAVKDGEMYIDLRARFLSAVPDATEEELAAAHSQFEDIDLDAPENEHLRIQVERIIEDVFSTKQAKPGDDDDLGSAKNYEVIVTIKEKDVTSIGLQKLQRLEEKYGMEFKETTYEHKYLNADEVKALEFYDQCCDLGCCHAIHFRNLSAKRS